MHPRSQLADDLVDHLAFHVALDLFDERGLGDAQPLFGADFGAGHGEIAKGWRERGGGRWLKNNKVVE